MASRPSQRQMEALVEFLERNPGIAKGLLRTQQAKVETRRKWQEFATATNALGGVTKDGPAWSKYWAEKECALKRQCQQRAQSMRRTGGGADLLPEPERAQAASQLLLELRLVAVMGGHSFALGDRGLAVDLFPQSSSQSLVILDQPSTSQAAAEIEVMNFELAPEIVEQVPNPTQSSMEQVEESHQADTETDQQRVGSHVQSETRQAPQARQRLGRRVSFLDTQVARFEEIESRRVEAEIQTAQALAKIATAMTEITQLLAIFLERKQREE